MQTKSAFSQRLIMRLSFCYFSSTNDQATAWRSYVPKPSSKLLSAVKKDIIRDAFPCSAARILKLHPSLPSSPFPVSLVNIFEHRSQQGRLLSTKLESLNLEPSSRSVVSLRLTTSRGTQIIDVETEDVR